MNPGLRLKAAADAVRPHKKVVDVGTDHAYLPAYLVLTGKATQVLAVDIGMGPLENARKTVEKYALSDRIGLRISDGLQAVQPQEAEDICLCGMGGTLMRAILSACPWLQKEDIHLVLQPQSHVWEVREFLFAKGFRIDSGHVLCDGGKLYITMSVFYDGSARDCAPGICYFGSLLSRKDENTLAYVRNLHHHLQIRLQALTKAGIANKETAAILQCLQYYEKNTNLGGKK